MDVAMKASLVYYLIKSLIQIMFLLLEVKGVGY